MAMASKNCTIMNEMTTALICRCADAIPNAQPKANSETSNNITNRVNLKVLR